MAMDQLEAQDGASFGEDPELLDSAEQALLKGRQRRRYPAAGTPARIGQGAAGGGSKRTR